MILAARNENVRSQRFIFPPHFLDRVFTSRMASPSVARHFEGDLGAYVQMTMFRRRRSSIVRRTPNPPIATDPTRARKCTGSIPNEGLLKSECPSCSSLVVKRCSRRYLLSLWLARKQHELALLSVGKSRKSRLRLDENAEKRTARWRFRTEIAHETIFRPNLHVTGCAICIVNED